VSPTTRHPGTDLRIDHNAPIETWFHIGGNANMLAKPTSNDQLLACLEIDQAFKVLGDGANLLVDDCGTSGLVVNLQSDAFEQVEIDHTTGILRAGSGVALPGLINRCVREGMSGLETLAGIPATVGGATIMNAGGAFGEICNLVLAVHGIDREGRTHTIDRSNIDFGYRQSHLNHLILTQVVFQLEPKDVPTIKASRDRCMQYKAKSQPLSDKSAGCVFKNPTLHDPIDGIGEPNDRVSAGMLIDRAGCKGMTHRGATVSKLHANFITTTSDTKARAVIELIALVQNRVYDAFGIQLDRELIIWGNELPTQTETSS
tara:strand:+ start:117308 stop:118258 length:951 start_codon:yes stop_codon:yes gene_type:complete